MDGKQTNQSGKITTCTERIRVYKNFNRLIRYEATGLSDTYFRLPFVPVALQIKKLLGIIFIISAFATCLDKAS